MHSALYQQTLIALLIDAWGEEFPLGTDRLLQVQTLVQQLDSDTTDEQIKNYLTALLVNNETEQYEFYNLFQQCQKQASALCVHEKETPADVENLALSNAKKGETRWIKIVIATTILLFLALLSFWLVLEEPTIAVEGKKSIQRSTVSPNDTLQLKLLLDSKDSLRGVFPEDQTASSIGGLFRIDTTGTAEYIPNDTLVDINNDTVQLLFYYDDKTDTIEWQIEIIEPSLPSSSVLFEENVLESVPIPFPSDLNALRIDKEQLSQSQWIQENEWYLKGILLSLMSLLLWALIKWQRYRKAKVIAKITQPDKAPYIWSPETGDQSYNWVKDIAQPLLNKFRDRTPDEQLSLDLPQTVQNTIRQAGRIKLSYKKKTLPSNYLLLIDRYSAEDHQTRIFEELFQELLRAEVIVNRYFFQGDLRLCFNEQYPHGISLLELEHKYANAELIIFGEGAGLLAPTTGRLTKWTELLNRWPNRALLTPKPLDKWSFQERELNEIILTLPASPQGLENSIDSFLSTDSPSQRELLPQVKDALQESFTLKGDLMESLHQHFSKPVVHWIAACALWPQLSWDLTLHLGKTIENENGTELVNFYNLRKIARLPWFSKGIIPERARLLLIDYLAKEGLEEKTRLSLRTLLASAPPPPGDSVAYEEYRMNIILNELMLKPDRASRKRLESEFAAYLEAGKKPDFVALQLLDRPVNRYDLIVGNALKKFAFKQGLPGLGWQLQTKALALWLLLAVIILPYQYDYTLCEGELINYQEQTYCLNNEQDHLLFLRVQAAEAVNQQQHPAVEQLRQSADSITSKLRLPADSAFYLNTAAHYYNHGILLFNCAERKSEGCNTAISPDSLQTLACENISRAKDIILQFGIDTNAVKVLYHEANDQICLPLQLAETNDTISPPTVIEDSNTPIDVSSEESTLTLEVYSYKLLDSLPLTGTSIYLFEYLAEEGEKLIDSLQNRNGHQFELLVSKGKRYVIKGSRRGYGPALTSLDLSGAGVPLTGATYRKNLFFGQLLEIYTFDASTKETLLGAEVSLYDPITNDLIADKINTEGNDFYFSTNLDKPYRVKVNRIGYIPVEEIITFSKEDLETGGGKITVKVHLNTELGSAITVKLQPLYLYFDIDQPHPNSRRTDSDIEYGLTNRAYLNRQAAFTDSLIKPDMSQEEAFNVVVAVQSFFENDVDYRMEELNELAELLYIQLASTQVKYAITLEGRASKGEGEGSAPYNLNLSKRRVDSVIDYFNQYSNGKLGIFINSGRLSFKRTYARDQKADPTDQTVYGVRAARDRVVVITEIKEIE